MKKFGKLSTLVAAAILSTGCATIVSDSDYILAFNLTLVEHLL